MNMLSSICAIQSRLPSRYKGRLLPSGFLVAIPPLYTSCDSSAIFHTLAVLSLPPVDTQRSRPRVSISVIWSWWPNNVSIYARSSIFHNLMVRSWDAEYNWFAPLRNASPYQIWNCQLNGPLSICLEAPTEMASLCCVNLTICLSSFTDQMLITLSFPPLARYWPSKLSARHKISSVWPSKFLTPFLPPGNVCSFLNVFASPGFRSVTLVIWSAVWWWFRELTFDDWSFLGCWVDDGAVFS